jgi:hypothetical protein
LRDGDITLAELILRQAEVQPATRARGWRELLAHSRLFHQASVWALGSAYGNQRGALAGYESQDLVHLPLAERQQTQVMIDGCVGKRLDPGGWIDSNVGGIGIEHRQQKFSAKSIRMQL